MSFQYLPIVVALFSLVFAYFLTKEIRKASSGSDKMVSIALSIREGAAAFLKRQYKAAGIVALFLFLILWVIFDFGVGIGFLVGTVASALAGAVGMMVSTKTNVKVSQAARSGLGPAFSLAFKGGSVTGFLVVGLGLFSVSSFYFLLQDFTALIALCFGASLTAIFARLGGGIYTKAADVGADLVGKMELGIPEDDPRNPAVIADSVGDNVGDCAGMAADIFQTYVITLVAAMFLGSLLFPNIPQAIFLPLLLASQAILASIVGAYFIKLGKEKLIMPAFYKGLTIAGVLSAIAFYITISSFSPYLKIPVLNLYLPALIGLLIAFGIFVVTNFFTSKKYSPVMSIATASQSGHAPNIIAGLAVGMKSTIIPAILILIGILISFNLTEGIYGLVIAIVSMISIAGLIVALDAYGPITDNAAGISEMAGLPKEARLNTDALDAVGNTTKAITKGYSIASAGLAALVLFAAYNHELMALGKRFQFSLGNPEVLVGLFLGGVIVYFFAALALEAVGKTAIKVVEEVRRQFREIKGLMEGKAKPDYSRCVDIVTTASLKEMVLPALLPIAFPILVGFILGPEALGGLLIGVIIVGFFLAIKMTSGGAAWDNAKKYIEEGNLGGKGSLAHQAAITGDIVGDPYKDTAGPAINPMIKILNIVALLIVRFLV